MFIRARREIFQGQATSYTHLRALTGQFRPSLSYAPTASSSDLPWAAATRHCGSSLSMPATLAVRENTSGRSSGARPLIREETISQKEDSFRERIQNSLEAGELMLGLGMRLGDTPTPMKYDVGYEADVDTPDPDKWEMVRALTEEMEDDEW
ncbi:hypothetical protein H0H92_003392 [Tricholoma furcatifolium]|nr:hypothetical protein H0H92_003392 [Tricholoma furcatifolium]